MTYQPFKPSPRPAPRPSPVGAIPFENGDPRPCDIATYATNTAPTASKPPNVANVAMSQPGETVSDGRPLSQAVAVSGAAIPAPVPTYILTGLDRLATSEPLLDDWPRRIEDARQVAAQWGAQARRLGWRDVELFGLHPRTPSTRHGAKGLAWLLGRGDRIGALTADCAMIEMASGVPPLKVTRKNLDPESVIAWEIAAPNGEAA